MLQKLKTKLEEYRRVLRVAVKPTKEEFITAAKITAIGVGILGFIGFAIHLIFIFLRGG
jgi:protein transport protein SEC61 subunit gamma-like protein